MENVSAMRSHDDHAWRAAPRSLAAEAGAHREIRSIDGAVTPPTTDDFAPVATTHLDGERRR